MSTQKGEDGEFELVIFNSWSIVSNRLNYSYSSHALNAEDQATRLVRNGNEGHLVWIKIGLGSSARGPTDIKAYLHKS
jgi:hypothetical protein